MTGSTSALLVYLAQEDPDYLLASSVDYGMKRVPKLGLMYLAAVLQSVDIRPRILDQSLDPFPTSGLADELRRDPPLFAGFYAATTMTDKVCRVLRDLRAAGFGVPLLVGGPDFHRAADYLGAGADFVVHGEGERTIVEIIEHLSGRRPRETLRGVSYLEGGGQVEAPPQPLIEDLDSLPMPVREPYRRRDDFHDFHVFNMRTPYTTMLASRGCPYRCTFCSSCNVWGHRVRQRSVASVVDEIEWCVGNRGIRYIGFRDDVFGSPPGWIDSFSDEMIRRRLDVLWSAMVHPFSFRGRRSTVLPRMRQAGCDLLIYGMQSADPGVLRNIRRSPDEPAELAEALEIARREDITTVVTVIFGLPGDSEETVATTLRYLLEHRPNYAEFNALSLLEGSEMKARYGDGPVGSLAPDEVRRLCSRGARRFYGDPRILWQDLRHVLRKNPRFFLEIAKHSRYVGEAIGLLTGPTKRPGN